MLFTDLLKDFGLMEEDVGTARPWKGFPGCGLECSVAAKGKARVRLVKVQAGHVTVVKSFHVEQKNETAVLVMKTKAGNESMEVVPLEKDDTVESLLNEYVKEQKH